MMCWAACDRLARIATHIDDAERATRWRATADRIHAVICAEAWDEEQGCFTESFGGKSLDASMLLISDLGFLSRDDPRFRRTVECLERHLRRGQHMFRYGEADDFGEPETAFNICTFWYINALAEIGREDEARGLFEEMLRCRTRLGLLSEDLDVRSGELWGNFPQTYSLVGIILGAIRLSKSRGRTRFEPLDRSFEPDCRPRRWQVRRWPRGRHPRRATAVRRHLVRLGRQDLPGEPAEPRLEPRGDITFATIDINKSDADGYYNGYCNGSLWPLFHYMLGIFRYERDDQEAYRRVNRLFARKLIPLLQPNDRVWVHDYHLIPLAEELRHAGMTQRIGFFLHVPFPSFDVLRTLPRL
jgi:hypothetical protein